MVVDVVGYYTSTGGAPPTGSWSTQFLAGYKEGADGTGAAANFRRPRGTATDVSGNVYVADSGNHTIRKITPAGVVTTFAGSPGTSGWADGTGSAARFSQPSGSAVDGSGNVFVADSGSSTIRKMTAAGVVTTLAGTSGVSGAVDGTGSGARFNQPSKLAVDGSGILYVADSGNNTIRKVMPAGVVTTLAGSAGASGSADGTGAAARFNQPSSVVVDASGNVVVADSGNHTIRKVTPAGVVTTLAGSPGMSGSVDGSGAAARFSYPTGVAVDGSGTVYVADSGNNTIRKVTPAGVVTTLAGDLFGWDDGTGAAASFSGVRDVSVDGSGNLYVVDSGAIRKVTPAGVVTTVLFDETGAQSVSVSGAGNTLTYTTGVAIFTATRN